MALILRSGLSRPLTIKELDQNFIYLDDLLVPATLVAAINAAGGVDADTLDGVDSTGFVVQGTLTAAQLNNANSLSAGIYTNNGDGIQDPAGSTFIAGHFYVIHMHTGIAAGYEGQIAVGYAGAGAGFTFFRFAAAGTWTAWIPIWTSFNDGPASGLSADASVYLNYPPRGFLVNGGFTVTVASNNITVAVKTLSGADPSAAEPVYCRIGDNVRAITSALSVTRNAGTNWFNAGGAELATKEIDYFVYLGYNATDGVTIGFARTCAATRYAAFSTTTTAETYCAISTVTNAVAADFYEVVGRFAATLSAGAGYTWSVPTYTSVNLIQRPIYETRVLTFVPQFTGFSVSPGVTVAEYKVRGNMLWVNLVPTGTGTSNATSFTWTLPWKSSAAKYIICLACDNATQVFSMALLAAASNTVTMSKGTSVAGNNWTNSGTKWTVFLEEFPI